MSTTPTTTPFLTVAEAAEGIGMCTDTIRDAIRRGDLLAFQPSGKRGRVLIPRDAFDAWIARPAGEAR